MGLNFVVLSMRGRGRLYRSESNVYSQILIYKDCPFTGKVRHQGFFVFDINKLIRVIKRSNFDRFLTRINLFMSHLKHGSICLY